MPHHVRVVASYRREEATILTIVTTLFGPRALPLLACGGSNTPLLHPTEEEEEQREREHEHEGRSKLPSPCLNVWRCFGFSGDITVGQISSRWRLTLALWFQFL